ncbi:MAG: VCBS domain-containing protein, partial [Candidatus Accumulibacter sp.]|nr:VCBS domain-containing protein [Accumulibacter sp.]
GTVNWHYDPAGTSKDHSNNAEVLDTIPIVVKEADGDTASGNLVINITDTAPQARPDSNSVTEDTATTASGNVLGGLGAASSDVADTPGADNPTTVTGVNAGTPASAAGNVGSVVTGQYGTLVLNSDGTYPYTHNNNDPLVQALNTGDTLDDTFTYTITDSDGDTSTTTLVITINGTDEGIPTLTVPDTNAAASGNDSVPENQTKDGSFTITAPDGLAPDAALTITGKDGDRVIGKEELENSGTTPITVTTPEGVLTINGYDPATGEVSWHYDPNGTSKDHSSNAEVLDTIPIVVKDADGDTQDGNLVINITDTAPEAKDDANSVKEDTTLTASGNVVTDEGPGQDTKGADDPTTVTGVTGHNNVAGVVGGNVAGQYGTLVLNPDGSYTYTLNNSDPKVQALGEGDTLDDTFTYTITDSDGDTSDATLTITINGTDDGVDLTIPNSDRNNPNSYDRIVLEGATLEGEFEFEAKDGLNEAAALTITDRNGDEVVITKAQLEAASSDHPFGPILTKYGEISIIGYDAANSTIQYRYTPLDYNDSDGDGNPGTFNNESPYTDPDGLGRTLIDEIEIVITDADGQFASATMEIAVDDSVPHANDDLAYVVGGAKQVGGNVIDNDTFKYRSSSDNDYISPTPGGDAKSVFGVSSSAGGMVTDLEDGYFEIEGDSGTLRIYEDGHYTYKVFDHISDTSGLPDEVFTYYVTDSDSSLDPDFARLVIAFNTDGTAGDDTRMYDGTSGLDGGLGIDTVLLPANVSDLDFSSIGSGNKLSNIERIDLLNNGQKQSVSLSAQDVIDITDGDNILTILGGSGDSVSLKDGVGAEWTKSGTEVGTGINTGHTFDVYTNAYDATVKVLIEQHIADQIVP